MADKNKILCTLEVFRDDGTEFEQDPDQLSNVYLHIKSPDVLRKYADVINRAVRDLYISEAQERRNHEQDSQSG